MVEHRCCITADVGGEQGARETITIYDMWCRSSCVPHGASRRRPRCHGAYLHHLQLERSNGTAAAATATHAVAAVLSPRLHEAGATARKIDSRACYFAGLWRFVLH